MSKECIDNCPRIQTEVENMPDAYPTVAAAGVLAACKASYDCPGPTIGDVEVRVGILRRRTEIVQDVVCNLDA